MFKIAVVIFREFLEISMLLGIVAAATKAIPKSRLYIIAGIMTGAIGSSILAFFASQISNSWGGFGDELLDVAVILLTVLMVGATAIWIKSYASNIKSEINKMADNITTGESPKYMIILVVAATMFREGTEIVIFVHGIAAASNLTSIDYIMGLGCGILGGMLFGLGVYRGLINLSVKQAMKVSYVLLALVAASLASEAAAILTSTGIIDIFNEPIWDFSNIIPDESVLGKVLKIFVGYNARPNGLQLAFYVGTLALIMLTSNIGQRRNA